MAERDYSGVSTAELAKVIKEHAPDYQNWAELNDIDPRRIRDIFEEKYNFTGLGFADKVCTALGLRIDDYLTVIPADKRNAGLNMATDELEIASLLWDLPAPTQEQIEARAAELRTLREEVLGPPTEAQIERLRADNERSKERLARQRQAQREFPPVEEDNLAA